MLLGSYTMPYFLQMEIDDEFDFEDFTEKQVNDREFIFSGRLEIDYLNEKYQLKSNGLSDEQVAGPSNLLSLHPPDSTPLR